jgi:hypothetical protein
MRILLHSVLNCIYRNSDGNNKEALVVQDL